MYYKIEYISKGKIKSVVIKAKSEIEALKKFKRKNLGIIKSISVFEYESIFEKIKKKLNFSTINLEEYIAALEQMHVMLDAGISIDSVIENVVKGLKDKKLKEIFLSIQRDIQAGLSLTESFSKFQNELGNITISMIQLGEETGDLSRAVKDLAVILSEILDNRKRLKKATRYPIFVVFAMMIAFIIVILFVIPPFKSIFAQLHTQLPLPTRFLLWLEHAIAILGPYILAGALIIFAIISYLYNTDERVRLLLDKWILKVYIVGQVIKLAMIGRFVYVLQRLIDAGIPIFDAVDIALSIVENSYIKKRLLAIRESIRTGGSISRGFEESGMFEEMTVQMIAAGEESGNLGVMLGKVSNYYLEKYRYIVDNIAVMIEPILIAAIAGFVMTLALGIFLPMWNLTEAIK